jgi:hypothetical protein
MAKRTANEDGPELPGGRAAGDTITAFADDLGKILGTARAKAEGWLGQRTQIAKTLESIRDTASKLLSDLGHQAQRAARKGRAAVRKKVATGESARPARTLGKKRKMSAKARAAISAAQKARWAKLRTEEKKK